MASLFAFLHHVGAFGLVAALMLEFVLIKDELTIRSARRLQITDLAVGISAAVVLVAGLLRVFFFEKGAAYYFDSAAFIAKLSLFVALALLSIYPTLQFLAWRAPIKEGRVPSVAPHTLRRIRAVIHLELAGIVPIVLFATLMARNSGFS
jgi:putative membrane protein